MQIFDLSSHLRGAPYVVLALIWRIDVKAGVAVAKTEALALQVALTGGGLIARNRALQ